MMPGMAQLILFINIVIFLTYKPYHWAEFKAEQVRQNN